MPLPHNHPANGGRKARLPGRVVLRYPASVFRLGRGGHDSVSKRMLNQSTPPSTNCSSASDASMNSGAGRAPRQALGARRRHET